MTDKNYPRTAKGIKELLNTLPEEVSDFTVSLSDAIGDYIEIDKIDYRYKIIFISGYYLNYN